VLCEPYLSSDGDYTINDEVIVNLNGSKYSYFEAESVIQKVKDKQAAKLAKENLKKAAIAKLTKKELEVLGL
jgi:hypothetical protein